MVAFMSPWINTSTMLFKPVLHHVVREAGTWITDEMHDAYSLLHTLGIAHSIEIHQDGHLVGGLYGIAMGPVFSANQCFPVYPMLLRWHWHT
ncbi:hypothetical protein HSBAA_17660 [Vreelandella sulfidaeris]|uniref:Leucyl/phenylalanyl-tRNA--protein transferase n=1 Tax=Vreelandella sulfidaeris TaxID=115553 RepID=A0A455U322_9GAMM|nr:hypothetical protein HSBAA_17660 [Halomonas sulfidaeris]